MEEEIISERFREQENQNNNKQDKNKLATAPLGKLMFNMAVPTILAQLVNLLYNMVDRMYVGRMPGEGPMALAGLGVCFPVILLISAFTALVSSGGAPKAAICLGKKDVEGAERILGASVAFLLLLAVALAGVFYIIKEPMLMLFGASEKTIVYADQYLKIYLLGTIAVQFSLGLNQFITCQGHTKISMMTVMIGAIINIVLDPILIFTFDLGVSGAALATIISQAVSAVWVVLFLCGKKSFLKIRWEYIRLDMRILKPVLMLGAAPFIMQATECMVQLTFNNGMQRYGNDYYVGAMAILFSVAQFVSLPMIGLTQGATPIISYNYGAGDENRVQKAFWILLKAELAFSIGATSLVLLFPQMFVSIFSADPEILRIGCHGLRIFLFGYIFMGAQLACQQTFVALGQAKISMFLALLRKVILLIPLALLLPTFGMGTDGLFFAEPIADMIAIITTTILFQMNFKKILAKGV